MGILLCRNKQRNPVESFVEPVSEDLVESDSNFNQFRFEAQRVFKPGQPKDRRIIQISILELFNKHFCAVFFAFSLECRAHLAVLAHGRRAFNLQKALPKGR